MYIVYALLHCCLHDITAFVFVLNLAEHRHMFASRAWVPVLFPQ